MAYVVVGAWLLRRTLRERLHPLLLVGGTSTLIGLGSFALHATATFLGQFLDEGSMFLLSALTLTLALRRLLGWSSGTCLVHYAAVSVASMVLLAIVRWSGIPIFGLQVTAAVVVELLLRRRGERGVSHRELHVALAMFGVALGVWGLDITRAACDSRTAHLLNGHVVWHVLSAACLAVYYRHQRQFFTGSAQCTRRAGIPAADERLGGGDRSGAGAGRGGDGEGEGGQAQRAHGRYLLPQRTMIDG